MPAGGGSCLSSLFPAEVCIAEPVAEGSFPASSIVRQAPGAACLSITLAPQVAIGVLVCLIAHRLFPFPFQRPDQGGLAEPPLPPWPHALGDLGCLGPPLSRLPHLLPFALCALELLVSLFAGDDTEAFERVDRVDIQSAHV